VARSASAGRSLFPVPLGDTDRPPIRRPPLNLCGHALSGGPDPGYWWRSPLRTGRGPGRRHPIAARRQLLKLCGHGHGGRPVPAPAACLRIGRGAVRRHRIGGRFRGQLLNYAANGLGGRPSRAPLACRGSVSAVMPVGAPITPIGGQSVGSSWTGRPCSGLRWRALVRMAVVPVGHRSAAHPSAALKPLRPCLAVVPVPGSGGVPGPYRPWCRSAHRSAADP
jgi:hypothetical protein